MPLSLIVGPPNSGRAGEIVRRLRDASAREPVLIVPTSDEVARFERELCAAGQAALGISIRTFGWLFEDLARLLGVAIGPRLSAPERLALIRVAIRSTSLRALRRSASRPGFAPALDALISELGRALIDAPGFTAEAAKLLDGELESELAELYRAYSELRDRSGRSDAELLAERVLAALRSNPDAWDRPAFVYGFDDLTVAQRELIAELSRFCEATVAVNYEDRQALTARAGLVSELREELGADEELTLHHDDSYSRSPTLVHLDRNLFEAGAEPAEPEDGLVLLEAAGERGEAEAIALEAARLIAAGASPDEILIVLRNPSTAGPLLAAVLDELGLPGALEAPISLERTGVGRSLLALCRTALPSGTPEDLLAHLRTDPALPPHLADWAERRIRRGKAETVDGAFEGWSAPPRHLARLRAAHTPTERLLALARSAREIAEGPHRQAAPLVDTAENDGGTPVVPLELRAGAAAAELLAELAAVGGLPGCEPPDLEDAIAAIESASVPAWRGPAEGRIRIVSPYRVRGARARFLFCASLQDGTFPTRGGQDPLLSEERRAALGIAALRRRDPADEERFLFHACVSRPLERLYLSWQSSDEAGAALARSPFVDEVLDLLAPGPDAAEARLKRTRGLEQVVPGLAEAPTERSRERALAVLEARAEVKPGPLFSEVVVGELAAVDALSAGSLERWLGCPYRWFVDHELRPERLDPQSDPLWLGGIVHKALERLYREPPGEDSIPRPGDVARWKQRFTTLLAEEADDAARGAERSAALARATVQVEAFLDDEAASETELRPHADFLEWSFGIHEDDAGPLSLGELRLHGIVDRVDVAPDGTGAVVRDYKTSKEVSGAAAFADKGLLQIPLYMRAVRDLGGLEPIAGIYQPLGAYDDRRPRGIARRDDERLAGLNLKWRTKDVCDAEALDDQLEEAVERAIQAATRMRAGRIGRRPLGGRCPTYCHFQSICRLERAFGVESEESEDES